MSTNKGDLNKTNPTSPSSPAEMPRKKRTRNRKVTWFNPPFSRNLKTNLAKEFLKLIDTNFTRDNPLSKIINSRTIKVSYSCTAHMASVISTNNQKILKEKASEHTTLPCNCRNEYILPNKCRSSCVIYKASTNRVEQIESTSNEYKT